MDKTIQFNAEDASLYQHSVYVILNHIFF